MKKLNWNTFVKVKLNALGRDIYYRQFDEINRQAGKTIIEPRFPEETKTNP